MRARIKHGTVVVVAVADSYETPYFGRGYFYNYGVRKRTMKHEQRTDLKGQHLKASEKSAMYSSCSRCVGCGFCLSCMPYLCLFYQCVKFKTFSISGLWLFKVSLKMKGYIEVYFKVSLRFRFGIFEM